MRFIRQSFMNPGVDGGVQSVFIVYTDITHIKSNNKISLSFIGLDGEPSYLNVALIKNQIVKPNPILTKREMDVLGCIAIGKNSNETANLLNISKHTIDTHRKNMLKKAECASINELLIKAVKEGWI